MTLNHFRALCEQEQQAVAATRGALVADRYNEHFTILLFQLHTFYVELYYQAETNEVSWVRSFDSIDDLEPYLSHIDVSQLVCNL